MAKQIITFPNGFLWGAATAAHQIEGNNKNSDWWAWEHGQRREQQLRKQGKNPADFYSGMACDSYNRFAEDFDLAEHMGHNATRLSIEWARIEPQEGKFSELELDHYEKVLQAAKARGLQTFVTLHHFTNPLWFTKRGGFVHRESVGLFTRYATVVAERLGEYVDFWLTFNEPEIYATMGYLVGKFPPQQRSLLLTRKVFQHVIASHNACAPIIKLKTHKPVSMAFHISDLQPAGFLASIPTALAHYFANEYIIRRTIQSCDFIGLNYYFHHHVGLFGLRKKSRSVHDVTDMGWGIHPEGLERVLLYLKKYNKPVYITENGLADAKDLKREKFIKDHLYYMHRAMEKGVDVRGYLHWALIDNFEWADGFGPRFGLVEVDRDNELKRKLRMSALSYAEICRTNRMEYFA